MAEPTGPSTRPYLPPRRSKLRALRNPLLLWVVLIVMFLAIWRFLNDGSDSGAARHHASSGTDNAILTLVMPGAFFVILLPHASTSRTSRRSSCSRWPTTRARPPASRR
jgi:hypothetical protein